MHGKRTPFRGREWKVWTRKRHGRQKTPAGERTARRWIIDAHPSFADTEWLYGPLVSDGVFERVEPCVIEVTEPPIRLVVNCHLDMYTFNDGRKNREAELRTVSWFGDCILWNCVLRWSRTVDAIVSRSWSGTMRRETWARTFDGITVESTAVYPHEY